MLYSHGYLPFMHMWHESRVGRNFAQKTAFKVEPYKCLSPSSSNFKIYVPELGFHVLLEFGLSSSKPCICREPALGGGLQSDRCTYLIPAVKYFSGKHVAQCSSSYAVLILVGDQYRCLEASQDLPMGA